MFNLPNGFITSFLRSQYTKLPYPETDFSGKVIVVTGSNVGLGLEAARHFTRLKAKKVILAVRTFEKGEAAVYNIKTSLPDTATILEVWRLDLNEYKSVIAFAKRLDEEETGGIDALICNAGIAIPRYEKKEGMEATIQVNVLATFLLMLLCLPVLRRRSKAILDGEEGEDGQAAGEGTPVVCVVASDAHFQAVFPEQTAPTIFTALNTPINQADKYNTSKLLEILIVRELAPALRLSQIASGKPPVILNCLTPGLCESDLMRHASPLLAVVAIIGKVVLARTTEVGARTIVAAAAAGDESHGEYMADCKVAETSEWVRSDVGKEVQGRVWIELRGILEGICPGVLKNI